MPGSPLPEPAIPCGVPPGRLGDVHDPPASGEQFSFITTVPWAPQLPQPLRLRAIGWLSTRGGELIVAVEVAGPRSTRLLEGRATYVRP